MIYDCILLRIIAEHICLGEHLSHVYHRIYPLQCFVWEVSGHKAVIIHLCAWVFALMDVNLNLLPIRDIQEQKQLL